MKVFVNHAHIFQKSVREDGTVESLKKVMDECSIDKAVCFAPFSDYFTEESKGESRNKWLYRQIKNDDMFVGFGTIDFAMGNFAEQVNEIYQLGFSGIKMHPAYQKFKIDCDEACEVYEAAEKLGLPISFHTGVHWYRISSYNTLLYDEIVFRFPKLKICMEHVGGYSFFKEALAVMCNNPKNVYAGITSVFDNDMNKFWYLGKENVKNLLWMVGEDKPIFGLDFPYNDAAKIKSAMQMMNECIDEMNLGETAREKAFGKNLEHMLAK